jgi:hypothetical protein
VQPCLDDEHAARQADAARANASAEGRMVTRLAVHHDPSKARAHAAVFLEGRRRRLVASALALGWLRARRSSFASLTR